MSIVIRKSGRRVYTSDIYRWHDKTRVQRAFEKFDALPKPFRRLGCDIVINPPFVHAQRFAEHALTLLKPGNKLCMILRIQFLEGNKRGEFFEKFPPRRVYVFSYRLPRMHRFLYKGQGTGSALAFALYVWQKGYKGSTEIRWIRKEKEARKVRSGKRFDSAARQKVKRGRKKSNG